MVNPVSSVCPYCNTEIKETDAVKICPSCSVAHHEACWYNNGGCTTFGCPQKSHPAPSAPAVCPNCGTPTTHGQPFCPTCGNMISQPAPVSQNSDVGAYIDELERNSSKKKLIIGLSVGAAVLAIIIILIVLLMPSVDSITLTTEPLTLKVGESATIEYVIDPIDEMDEEVTWTSSNTSVATVNSRGKVTAHNNGTCIITATVDGKTDSVSVTVYKLSYEESLAVGTWMPVGYLQDGNFRELPSYGGNFYVYDDFTGMLAVDTDTYMFEWEFIKESDDTYVYSMDTDTVGTLTFAVAEIAGEDCVIILIGDMSVVYTK